MLIVDMSVPVSITSHRGGELVGESRGIALYPVGIAAQRAGLSPRQLRYYEALGLIEPQRRGTRRLYTEFDVALLTEIRRLHRAGTRLDRIRETIAAFRQEAAVPAQAAPPAADELGDEEDNDLLASALGRRPPPSLYPLRDRRAIEERLDRYERDKAPVESHPGPEKERSHGEPGNPGDGRSRPGPIPTGHR
jgi:DNA-binding transcriptional MerR regulator